MSRHTRAAVVRAAGEPPKVETLTLAELLPDEVLIQVDAAGICHTDRAMASGQLWPTYPVVLGHEIAGTVLERGSDVTEAELGQRVLVMDGHCGRCADCTDGHPVQCRAFDQSERQRHLRDSEGVTVLQSVGGFSDRLISPVHSVFAIPDDIPSDVAAVIGCCVVTGFGAVFNVAQVQPGQSVAVLGCGGVGINAVMAAAAAGATSIVGVDPDPERRGLALELGATDVCAPGDLQQRYPLGFHVAIECVGQPAVMTMATESLRRGGCAVLVGATSEGVTFPVNALDLILDQRRVLGCLRGDVSPSRDFPTIFALYRSGALLLDKLITERISLDELGHQFGEVALRPGLRTVVIR